MLPFFYYSFFFFKDTPTTEIYTLSLHDALPIYNPPGFLDVVLPRKKSGVSRHRVSEDPFVGIHLFGDAMRSEEHTSELQSRGHLVCRLLLEKKKKQQK